MLLYILLSNLLNSIDEDLYDDLRPLFQLDRLLLPLLMYICPIENLPKLFLLLPLYHSAAWLFEIVRTRGRHSIPLTLKVIRLEGEIVIIIIFRAFPMKYS